MLCVGCRGDVNMLRELRGYNRRGVEWVWLKYCWTHTLYIEQMTLWVFKKN